MLFSHVRVNSYSVIENSVVLPDVSIARDCKIKNAVIDRGCVIPKNTIIGHDPAADADRFYISEGGTVLVTPEMLGQELHYVR